MKRRIIACMAFLILTASACVRSEWRAVKLDSFAVSVPYSKDWRSSTFEADPGSGGIQIFRFGKPTNTGTSVTPEYFLYREQRSNQPEQASLEYLKSNLRCVDGFAGRIVVIGDRTGVEHHMGGAKGCSTGFVFNEGEYSYYIYRVVDIGKGAPKIGEDMRKIIQSIKP